MHTLIHSNCEPLAPTSRALHDHRENKISVQKKKRKKEGEGVVSIRGSLCPCSGVEFWFYLIGGSHPLFRDAGAIRHVSLNNSGRSFANSEAASAAAVVLLLLFHTFLVTSSHSSCPPAPRRLLLDTLRNPRVS